MKKLVLIIAAVSFVGFSQAEYTFKVPLEMSNGGNLPNGSIIIGDAITPPVTPPITPPEATDECQGPVTGSFAWRVNKTTGIGNVFWNGTVVGSISVGATSVSGLNGIVYTKDENSTPIAGAFNIYGVCRNIPGGFNGGTWNSISPIITAWVNTGSVHSCTWTPDASNYLATQSVDQTGINCKQDQKRTTQNREQNDSTLVIRNVGSLINTTQTVDTDESPTRTVAGTDTTSDPETCINVAYSSTTWSVDLTDNNNVSYISWKGATLSENQQLGDITTFTHNGVVYKRGEYTNDLKVGQENVVYGKAYGVCRVNH